MTIRSAIRIVLVLLFAHSALGNAAELKLLCVVALTSTLNQVGPQFERETGDKLAIRYGASPAFKNQIEAGEAFDLAILTAPVLDELTALGKVAGDTRAVIAR